MISRLVFFPLPLATTAVFLSTYPPSSEWQFTYGLGGIFGDTILVFLLETGFLDPNTLLHIISVSFALLTFILTGFLTATDLKETKELTKLFFSSLLDGVKLSRFLIKSAVTGKTAKSLLGKINNGKNKLPIINML